MTQEVLTLALINRKLDEILAAVKPVQKERPKYLACRRQLQPFIYKKMADKSVWSTVEMQAIVASEFPDCAHSAAKDAMKTLAKKGKIKKLAVNVDQRKA